MNINSLKASFTEEITDLEIENRELALQIAKEAVVLLENDRTLPLDKNIDSIALYGNGARYTIYGGTGSGEVNSREQVNVEKAIEKLGIKISTLKWLDDYEQEWKQKKQQYIEEHKLTLKRLNTKMLAELIAAEYQYPYGRLISESELKESNTDTCIYVIARQSGEGKDRTLNKGEYRLTDIEVENIKKCANFYEKFILVFNTGSSMDLEGLKGITGINSIIYMSLLGMESGNALAAILFGDENPSGRLAATWVKDYKDLPSANYFGDKASNINEVNYIEEGLVGYRYFDKKSIEVKYPFGHGLSYTSFTTKLIDYAFNQKYLSLNLNIKNVGESYAGKNSICVYIGKKESILQENEAKKILIDFCKTKLLNPGQSTDINLIIPIERLGEYFSEDNKTKILQGEYQIYIGGSVVEATHAATFYVENEILICDHNCFFTNEKETSRHIKEIISKFSVKELIELCVGNGLFSDGRGYQVPGAVGSTSASFLNVGIRNLQMCDGPAGIRLQRRSTIGKKGKIKPLDYPLSFYELLPEFIAKSRLGNPNKEQVVYQFVTGFPVATALAQTFNKHLAKLMGQAVGKEMEKYGVDLWLAPAVNIIRNPLCGRNYEYYSEDPILSGLMGAAITIGVQSIPRCGVTVKHFACNNQETNRYYMSSNMSEKTLRDIYLKPFELIVKQAKPHAIMTAYNKVNGVYASENKLLLWDILRGEWQFDGLVMTDWLAVGEDRADEAKSISAGVDLIMPGSKKNKKRLYKEFKQGQVSEEAIRRAAGSVVMRIMEG